jgi:hypothetical protein
VLSIVEAWPGWKDDQDNMDICILKPEQKSRKGWAESASEKFAQKKSP